MIFGFNTDVRFSDTVYHVQSEARQHELVLQTLVFLKGRCVGKRTSSYADQVKEPGFSEEHMHEMLKDQHKQCVAAVREGRIEAELSGHAEHVPVEATAPATARPIAEFTVAAEAVAGADSHIEEPAAVITPAIPEAVAPVPALIDELTSPSVAARAADSPVEEPAAVVAPPEASPEAIAPAPALSDELSSPPAAAMAARSPVEEPAAEVTPPEAVAPAPAPVHELVARLAAVVPGKPVDSGLTLTPAGSLIGKGISLECRPPMAGTEENAVTIGVQIGDEDGPAAGAQVSCRITSGSARATYVYATASDEGVADVHLALQDLDLSATALLIQASHRGKSASRKFRLQTTP